MTHLSLPFPPSVNGLFTGKSRRFKSKSYKEWIKIAKAELDTQRYINAVKRECHLGQVNITMHLKAPDNRIRDIDNCIKAVLDFLVAHKVIIADDSRYLRSIFAEWRCDMETSGCLISIEDIIPVTSCPTSYAIGSITDKYTAKPKVKK